MPAARKILRALADPVELAIPAAPLDDEPLDRHLLGLLNLLPKELGASEAFAVRPIVRSWWRLRTRHAARSSWNQSAIRWWPAPASAPGYSGSASPLFTDPAADSPIPSYLDRPEAIFEPIRALPDCGQHGLGDSENSPAITPGD